MRCLKQRLQDFPSSRYPHRQDLVELLSGQPGVWLASEISAQALENACARPSPQSIRAAFHHSWIEPFDRQNAIPAYEA